MANAIPLAKEPIDIPPYQPAVLFLDNQITEVHPKFGRLQPTYSAEDGQFVERMDRTLVAIDETQEMLRQKELFLKAVAKFESGKDGVKTGVRLDVSAYYGWADVMRDLQSIENAYSRVKDEGTVGRVRYSLRLMRRWKSPCEQWLKAAKASALGFVARIFAMRRYQNRADDKAASSMNLVHDEIVDAIDEIPLTIERMFKLSRVYNTEAMQSHVSQLFVAILDLLQECLVWLKKHPVRKGLSAVFKGEEHAAGLRNKREQLGRLAERIDKYSMVGLHETSQDTNDRVRRSSNVLNHLHDFMKEGEAMLLAEMAEARKESARYQKSYEEVEKELRMAMEIQKRKYLEDVKHDPTKPVNDLISCVKANSGTYIRAQDRAAWILRSGQIGIWVLDSRSQVMVINSHEANHERHSPVSLFSAMLVRSLVKARAGIILYWSCGENVHGNTEDIVRHMVGQLLQEEKGNMSIRVFSLLADSKPNDFDAVMALLLRLLEEHLESSSIFIILDSISSFEDTRRATETRQLFDELHSFIETWSGRHPLKVLATSPTRCSYLGTFLDDWKPVVLSVPEVVEGHRLRRMSLALPHLEQGDEDESE